MKAELIYSIRGGGGIWILPTSDEKSMKKGIEQSPSLHLIEPQLHIEIIEDGKI